MRILALLLALAVTACATTDTTNPDGTPKRKESSARQMRDR